MASLRRIPYRVWLLIIVILAMIIAAIEPTDPSDMMLEHIPTVVFLLWLIVFEIRQRSRAFSNLAYTLMFVFLMLHILGAHYLYMNVPYDRWSEAIIGRSLSDIFDWERNHYDRLVHLCFGLLMTLPAYELVRRYFNLSLLRQLLVTVTILVSFSTLYELAEWGLTMVVSPEAAENYNGQQGDMFDAQKDMALALAGKVFVALLILVFRPGKR